MIRSQQISRRSGYALLMCLMVVAVTSSVVLTLFNILRLNTAESMARQQVVVSNAVADGAFEHGLAILIDDPNFTCNSGEVVFNTPTVTPHSYTLGIQQSSQTVQIRADLQVGGYGTSVTRFYLKDDLRKRRLELGLE